MANRSRAAIVTGSTGAIGQAIAAGLAALPNHEVILVGRDESKLRRLVAELQRRGALAQLRYELVDLSSRQSITELGRRIDGPIDVLVNNAAVAPPRRQQTERGIELVFATNVLGYVWMTRELLPALQRGEAPRVVNVASYWAGDLELDDLEFKQRRYDNDAAYRQSKQANRMLTVAWADRLRERGITVNCCHPGDVNSRLSNDLGFGGSEAPAEGAAAPLWLATSNDLVGQSGGYYEHERKASCRFSQDRTRVERLAQICDSYV